MKKKIVAEHLEKVVTTMGLPINAFNTLLALCNRADGGERDSWTSVTSPEGARIMPSLQKYGLEKAGQLLSRNIRVSQGELLVSPYLEKQEAA